MLKLKYMFENYELAKLALKNWEYDEKSLIEYLKHFRISSNAVYPFASGGKRCFLRLSPVEEKQEQNLKGELEFLQYLQRSGYTAMVPVLSRTGNLLLKLDTEWGQYYASVFEGVPGKSIEDTDYSQGIMISFGKALGRLHRLSMEYSPVCRKWSYREALAWIKSVMVESRAPEIMLSEADSVEKELETLEHNDENYGLVHYDFEPDNVFYNDADGECHVIDFEDGMYHFFLVDVWQVFDALSDELEGEALCRAKEYFLQGYQSEKMLDSEYEQKLPLMRRFCNLYSYARLIRCIADKVPNAPEWMEKMCKRLESKIKMLECGVETITYMKLSEDNFNEHSLDEFVRHQVINESWRRIDNKVVLVPNRFVEDWNLEKRREIAGEVSEGIKADGVAYGAFRGNLLIGYICVSTRFFGSDNQYMEVKLFHVSEPFRRKGIGRELFKLVCNAAKELGAKKLYISAHPSKESQEAYRRLGCVEAEEINQEIAENEPFDIQMEYCLEGMAEDLK